MKHIHNFQVIQNEALAGGYFILHLQGPEKLPQVLPGQFAEVLVENSQTTYLRRPFSIYDVDSKKNTLSLLLKKVGYGTHQLATLKEGGNVNLVYPLGNAFTLLEKGKALLVGGGVGIAPMLMLSRALKNKGVDCDVLIGGRSSQDVIQPEKYEPQASVHITTDDGSLGTQGMVTQHPVMTEQLDAYDFIYTCGPDGMMKAVSKLAFAKNIPCEASLENLMACGIGACLCCVVETIDGNKPTCVEGPVFQTERIKGWR